MEGHVGPVSKEFDLEASRVAADKEEITQSCFGSIAVCKGATFGQERPLDNEEYMKKYGALMGATLLCSIVISFGGATYLLNNKLLFAVVLIALYFLYFFGGLWTPVGKIGTKVHAVWIGIGIGFLGAILFFLPSAFAT